VGLREFVLPALPACARAAPPLRVQREEPLHRPLRSVGTHLEQGKPYYEGEAGASTGIKRWNYLSVSCLGLHRRDPLPAAHHLVWQHHRPGYELPPLYENVEELAMSEGLEEQYEALEKGCSSKHWRSCARGMWACSRPGSRLPLPPGQRFPPRAGRLCLQERGRQIHWQLPPVVSANTPWLPKEVKLADLVRCNMQHGRKTLTFVEQTGTRDIRERLKQVIETLVPGGSLTLVKFPRWRALRLRYVPG